MGMVFAVLFKVKTSISIKDGELDKEVLFPIGSIYTHPQGISLPPPREPSLGQAATGAPPGGQGASGLLPSPCAASLYSLWLPPLGPSSPGSRGLRKPRKEEKERKDGEKLHKATELGSNRRKRGGGHLQCPTAPSTPASFSAPGLSNRSPCLYFTIPSPALAPTSSTDFHLPPYFQAPWDPHPQPHQSECCRLQGPPPTIPGDLVAVLGMWGAEVPISAAIGMGTIEAEKYWVHFTTSHSVNTALNAFTWITVTLKTTPRHTFILPILQRRKVRLSEVTRVV